MSAQRRYASLDTDCNNMTANGAPMTRSLGCAFIALVCASSPVGAQTQPPPATSVGHDFAMEFCTACHVVASDQRQRPIYRGPTPSFAQIANRSGTTADSLRHFVRTTHPTIARPLDMPDVELSDYQLDEIIRYIVSL